MTRIIFNGVTSSLVKWIQHENRSWGTHPPSGVAGRASRPALSRTTFSRSFGLGRPGLVVWAYTRRGRFLGLVEINHAGLAAYTGKKGTKRLGDMRWEEFFERLGQKELTAAALSRYVRGVK